MATFLQTDANDHVIPALRPKAGGAHVLDATAVSSVRNPVAFDAGTRVIAIYAAVPLYIAFGGDTITAETTDHYFPEGIYYTFSVGGHNHAHYTHVAVRAAGADGSVYISELE